MSDIQDKDEQIMKKLQELQNFHLRDEGLLIGQDFKGVSVIVQELQHALFHRQHRDIQKLDESVKELTKSSRRVEKLTWWLIGITIALSGITILDVLKPLVSN